MSRMVASLAYLLGAAFCTLASATGHADETTLGSLPSELERGENAAETLQLNTLGLVHQRLTKISLIGIPIVREDTWYPVVGKYRYGLSREEFYLRVGKPELAAQQSSRDTTSNILFYGGFAVALSGIVVPLVTQDEDGVTEGGILIGAALFVGGVVMSNIGSAMSGPVIDQTEAEALAQRYNGALALRVSRGASSSLMAPIRPVRSAKLLGYGWHF